MKKTYTINISGTVFHIEEDAYEKLNLYLTGLKQHFGNDAEGAEIVADIEARIAEIFQAHKTPDKEVITMEWVDEVIETMGVPEDFEAEGTPGPRNAGKTSKRLYRDPDHKTIGGVCSGLAAYFTMDPVIMRLIFFVLLLLNGLGLLIYIILWIAVPEARTTAQRLEMRGEPVTIENIEKWIKKEYQDIKKRVKKPNPGKEVRKTVPPKE
jgi:phage shock protein PspC (stress-responsive transcriptional regulator)